MHRLFIRQSILCFTGQIYDLLCVPLQFLGQTDSDMFTWTSGHHSWIDHRQEIP